MKAIRVAGIILGVLGFVLVGFLVVGYLLPSGWSTERSAVIPAPSEEIFPYLESAEAWALWTPSPDAGVDLFGPEVGEGSGRRWDDDRYGEGQFLITAVDRPRRVEYEVEVEGGAIQIQGVMELAPAGQADRTRLTWREVGDFGWNPLLGFLAGRMDELQGGQLEASLESLRRLVVEGEVLTPEEESREERAPS